MKTPQNNTKTSGCRVGSYRDGYTITYRQGIHDISANTASIKIDYREGYNDDPGFGCNGRCGQYQEYCDGVEVQRTLSQFATYENRYNGPDPIDCTSNTCKPIDYKAVLVPKLNTPSDRICEKKLIFPTHSDGNNHTVSGLTWEFYSSNGRWENIPNFSNRFPLNVSILDIFGSSWGRMFDGNLQLRFRIDATFISASIYSKSTYTIQLTECSPELVGPILPVRTKCNYSNDGKFSMTVDRNLVPTERLIVSLYNQNLGNPIEYDFFTQEAPTSLQRIANGRYRHTWQGNLPAGNYRLKYQTLKGNGNIPDTDPSWATLEFSPIFRISKSDAFQYSAQIIKDETCKTKADGEIELEVTGGERGRNYSYIVYRVDGSSVTIHKNWTAFSGSNTTVSSLGKDTYRLQVRDNEECYAR
ncbi:hypothetical protein [Tenacibaculum agarivorans]|uniref:hypothetical protein n=1 Tax=Tenacibaculum agarivorans TaxID=1908389 RepID=UPI00094B98F2|nr:hypothetical protein [Tenacibaculum agarivorans]